MPIDMNYFEPYGHQLALAAILDLIDEVENKSTYHERFGVYKKILGVGKSTPGLFKNESINKMADKINKFEELLNKMGEVSSVEVDRLENGFISCLLEYRELVRPYILFKYIDGRIEEDTNREDHIIKLMQGNKACSDHLQSIKNDMTLEKICLGAIGRSCKSGTGEYIMPGGDPTKDDIKHAVLDIIEQKCITSGQPQEKITSYLKAFEGGGSVPGTLAGLVNYMDWECTTI